MSSVIILNLRFESSVILQGSKTYDIEEYELYAFESSVILQGSKTYNITSYNVAMFESSVILQGSKTAHVHIKTVHGLRVV